MNPKKVKWSGSWLDRNDANEIKIRQWALKKSETHASCLFCHCDLKFETQGFQALKQHSTKPKHVNISNVRFNKSKSQTTLTSRNIQQKDNNKLSDSMLLQAPLQHSVSAAEAMWVFFLAEKDLSLRDCDQTPLLFQKMFAESNIAKNFNMSKSKASYILQDGIGPLLLKNLCESVTRSKGCFTLMFDETTTEQKVKQMDILVRFFDEESSKVLTKYLGSLKFSRATAVDITKMLTDLIDDKVYPLPFDKLFNISTDGPNINKAIWRNLHSELEARNFKGLLPFVSCTLHTVHNAFRKFISAHPLGDSVQQLAFDLHAWFQHAPCKIEDFRLMAESVSSNNEALFFRHINTRWLTLSPALKKILERWDDVKKYFLVHIPSQKEYKSTLTSNKRYKRIRECIEEQEKDTLAAMEFILSLAPLFENYLKVFQSDGPLVQFLFSEMKILLTSLMKRFIKPESVDGKQTKEILKIDLSDKKLYLSANALDYGTAVKQRVSSFSETKKKNTIDGIIKSFATVTKYLIKSLPLDSQILQDAMCLNPRHRQKYWTVAAIGRLSVAVPHIVDEREVSLIKDEWKILQNEEEIAEDWYMGELGLKQVDAFWSSVFKIRNDRGEFKYTLLPKVVKSILSLQNGNASVERSLSDNKNTLTSERTNLNKETLEGLRRAKEYARGIGGAHNVNTASKEMVAAIQGAHSKYVKRKEEEREARKAQEALEEQEKEEAEEQKALAEKQKKQNKKLNEKEKMLQEDEKNVEAEQELTRRMLKDAKQKLDDAIEAEDMIGIKVAREIYQTASQKFEKVTKHTQEISKVRAEIGVKRKKQVEKSIANKFSKK